jgi:hypothetical protein
MYEKNESLIGEKTMPDENGNFFIYYPVYGSLG